MKHAIKALQILKDDRLKEYDRIMSLISSNDLGRDQGNEITAAISVQLFEINEEIKILENL